MRKGESISELGYSKIRNQRITNAVEFNESVKRLEKQRYPSVSLEKKRTVTSRYSFSIDSKYESYSFESIVKSFLYKVNKKINYKHITQGQYIMYEEKGTLGLITELLDNIYFKFIYIEEDSIYNFQVSISDSLKPWKTKIRIVDEVFLPFAADVFGFKTFSSRVDYKLKNKDYHKNIKINLLNKIEKSKK